MNTDQSITQQSALLLSRSKYADLGFWVCGKHTGDAEHPFPVICNTVKHRRPTWFRAVPLLLLRKRLEKTL